jgi:predicted membrane-bound mannosyltransferase
MKNLRQKFVLAGILLLITLLALFFRMIGIDKPSGLWFDEALTYYSASQQFPLEIIKSTVHAPLHFLMLHLWMNIFGSSDIVLRLFSVFLGVITVPVMYFFGREFDDFTDTEKKDGISKTGITAAILASINSLLIYYSQEVRFYALIVLFSALSGLFTVKLLKKPSLKIFITLLIINLLLISSYILGIGFIFFETLLILGYFYVHKKDQIKAAIIYTVSGIACSLVLTPALYYKIIAAKTSSDEYLISSASFTIAFIVSGSKTSRAVPASTSIL